MNAIYDILKSKLLFRKYSTHHYMIRFICISVHIIDGCNAKPELEKLELNMYLDYQ